MHKFGIVSDTHFGHRSQQLTHLREFYELAKTRGCRCIFHAGDLTDGISLHSDPDSERFLFSANDTVRYVVDNYPSDLQTFFISGNHDEKFVKNVGVDVCTEIADARPDMHFMGSSYAAIMLNGVNMFLAHGMGSGAASTRLEFVYKMATRTGYKPDVVVNGHVHSWGMNPYYNGALLLQTPCFLGQTSNMKRSGTIPSIGAAILYISDTGSRSVECISYDEIKNDF